MMAKSWVEKRDCGKTPHIKILEKPFAGMKQGCRMLISSPQEIDRFIRELPEGEVITPKDMRQRLANKHKADATCPVSTGIFLRIVCEAALEEHARGKPLSTLTPFWRIDLENTTTATKLSIDQATLKAIRAEAENQN